MSELEIVETLEGEESEEKPTEEPKEEPKTEEPSETKEKPEESPEKPKEEKEPEKKLEINYDSSTMDELFDMTGSCIESLKSKHPSPDMLEVFGSIYELLKKKAKPNPEKKPKENDLTKTLMNRVLKEEEKNEKLSSKLNEMGKKLEELTSKPTKKAIEKLAEPKDSKERKYELRKGSISSWD